MSDDHYRLRINIRDVAGVRNRGGEYFWTVSLVRISPEYDDLGIRAIPVLFRFEAGGGGDSGGDGGGGTIKLD